MAYYKDSRGIKRFEPDNDVNTYYISSGCWSLEEMLEMAISWFGEGTKLSELEISAKYIHTDCIGYDLYDARDYTNYIVIRRR